VARQSTKKQYAEDLIPESDQRPGAIHPRLSQNLFGQKNAEQEILKAISGGRMPHAWIIQGPPGIGKATFAYRVTKYLLDIGSSPHEAASHRATLEINAEAPSARLIGSRGHPDLFVLRREWDRKNKRFFQNISVDNVRKAITHFDMTAAIGKYRIGIVDSADDLNRNSVNALLKTLEEPSDNGIFFLLSSAPGRLPATIHSRCRHLTLASLNQNDFGSALSAAIDPDSKLSVDESDIPLFFNLSRGSPGRAIDFIQGSGLKVHQEVTAILDKYPRLDIGRAHALARSVEKMGADAEYRLTVDILKAWIHERARCGSGNPAHWMQVWNQINDLVGEALALNLNKRRTLMQIFNMLPKHCSTPSN
jgi:DNA polymerase III subunit delta'